MRNTVIKNSLKSLLRTDGFVFGAAIDKKKNAGLTIPSPKLKVLETVDHLVSDRIRAKAIKQQLKNKSIDDLVKLADIILIGKEAEDVRLNLVDSFKRKISSITPSKMQRNWQDKIGNSPPLI